MVFGTMLLSDAETDLVMRALRPICDVKTDTAVKLRSRI
jgi:hypothetical protein